MATERTRRIDREKKKNVRDVFELRGVAGERLGYIAIDPSGTAFSILRPDAELGASEAPDDICVTTTDLYVKLIDVLDEMFSPRVARGLHLEAIKRAIRERPPFEPMPFAALAEYSDRIFEMGVKPGTVGLIMADHEAACASRGGRPCDCTPDVRILAPASR